MQKKSQKHFVWGHSSSFCSVMIKARLLLLFHYKTTCGYSKDDRGMGMAYHFFIIPVTKVSIWQLWTTRGMDIYLPGNSN